MEALVDADALCVGESRFEPLSAVAEEHGTGRVSEVSEVNRVTRVNGVSGVGGVIGVTRRQTDPSITAQCGHFCKCGYEP